MAQKLTPSDVKGMFEKLSNWGRWGKDDQRGALNFITNQKRAAAARLVQTGESVSMALPLATIPAARQSVPGYSPDGAGGPRLARMQALPYAGDYFAIAPHGMANTHIDALCHVFWKNKMYNGFDASEVGSHGAKKCAIDVTRTGIVSRGVLLDIPLLKKIRMAGARREDLPRRSRRRREGAKGPRRRRRRPADSHRPRRDAQGQRRHGTRCASACPASMPVACHGSTSGASPSSAATPSATSCPAVTTASCCRFTSARWSRWASI